MRGWERDKRPQGFKRSFIMEGFRRKTIGEVSSCSKGFRLERSRGMRFYQEGSGDFKKGAIFSFRNPILLWGVRVRILVNHAMVRNELFHG